MQLSLRLSAIAGLVTRGNRLVDVGCDHGYLPVSLYLDGKIPGAIAMDVRKGPLSRAQEHISQYGLDAYIETRLSDGLEALKPGEGDTLVIAGMGGPLMERILTDGAEVRESFRELRDKRVIELDLPAMLAGTRYRGDFEERLTTAMDEISAHKGELIVFIDEVHTVVGAG